MGAKQIPNLFKESPLHQACKIGNIELVRLMLSYPDGVQAINEIHFDCSPLCVACYAQQIEIIKLFLTYPEGIRGLSLGSVGNYTPLSWACFRKSEEMAKILLQTMDDNYDKTQIAEIINRQDQNGASPLSMSLNQPNILTLFRQYV